MNNEVTQLVSLVSTTLGTLVAVLGIFFVSRQVKNANETLVQLQRNQVAELKPYLSVAAGKIAKSSNSGVLLTIANHGRTPATRITLDFEAERSWNHVRPNEFPFSKPAGISVLVPGESKTYFLGRLGVNAQFDRFLKEDIQVVIAWDSEVSEQREIQAQTISLRDGRFLAEA